MKTHKRVTEQRVLKAAEAAMFGPCWTVSAVVLSISRIQIVVVASDYESRLLSVLWT